jgi:hypothetical protein
MGELFVLEGEEVDLGVEAQGAMAERILPTKFCEGRESWSKALMKVHL